MPLHHGIQLAFGTVLVTYGESRNGMPALTHIGSVDADAVG
ncbi:MAG TPA: hypothetical protein VFR96_06635 [Povalibacter sp.]|nr:hypothetical protein [Povalibacter sp.]